MRMNKHQRALATLSIVIIASLVQITHVLGPTDTNAAPGQGIRAVSSDLTCPTNHVRPQNGHNPGRPGDCTYRSQNRPRSSEDTKSRCRQPLFPSTSDCAYQRWWCGEILLPPPSDCDQYLD